MKRVSQRQEGAATGVLLVLMTAGFIGTSVFGIWAFSERQAAQTDLDQKIAVATAQAVEEAEAAKEVEFTEREKNPFRRYAGSATYGSLTFDFPKSWNVYVEESDSGTILDFYAHPDRIPGLARSVNFAFRAQILDSTYDEEVSDFDRAVENGSMTATAFRAENVPSVLGVLLEGEVVNGKQGQMVLLPQRDKTFRLWTESVDFTTDFQNIIKTIDFVP